MTSREPDNEIKIPLAPDPEKFRSYYGFKDKFIQEDEGAPRCPNCNRVMSMREAEEQHCCNDCYDGTIPWVR